MRASTIALLLALSSAWGDIDTVRVPPAMLHAPGTGTGYSGKVTYTLAAGVYDSVFVALEIIPVSGGQAMVLDEVVGDVGRIPIIDTAASETRQIFFRYAGPTPAGEHVARVTATAEVSDVKHDVDSILATLSLAEKVTLLGGNGGFENGTAGGVPPIYMADGPHGVRVGTATLFPTCVGLAATWDTSVAYLQGRAKGREFRAKGKNCSLGPAMNIIYHPQGGRAFEYYSEDPYLAGAMAVADVRGIQDAGAIATIKHYACNQRELNRYEMSSEVDERSLREIYLYGFRMPIAQSGALAVMSAYNKINGSWASSNRYAMTDVLRDDWGFAGIVMTDWTAQVDNFSQAALWGSDINMPNTGPYTLSNFSTVDESVVDMHARRVIYVNRMIGAFEQGYSVTDYQSDLMSDEHRAITRRAGTKGIVLARNDGDLLPLPKQGASIAITGPSWAQACRNGGGGSSVVSPPVCVGPYDGIAGLLDSVATDRSTITTDINSADYIIVCVGVTGESEGGDRPGLGLSGGNDEVTAALAVRPNHTVVVFTGGSACTEGVWSTAPAVVIALYPGEDQGNALADILFGDANPCGKLPVTFPRDSSQLPNWEMTAGNAALLYPRADSAHGYFRVNKMEVDPLFAFGHGLSYTTFSYANIAVFPSSIVAGDRVTVQTDITNTGEQAGEEVVQLYLSLPQDGGMPVRVQDLRGFTKVSLDAGETETVSFTLYPKDMAYFDNGGSDFDDDGGWEILAGTYGVRLGTSSAIVQQASVSETFDVQ